MPNLWVTAAAFQIETAYSEYPAEEAVQRRRQRIDQFLRREHEKDRPGQIGRYRTRGLMPLREKWSPYHSGADMHKLLDDYDGPDDEGSHWNHLPDEQVSLNQRIHTHQAYVYPDDVRRKLNDEDDNIPFSDDYRSADAAGDDPKFIRHEGEHYMLDGHHRLVLNRLMGHNSMWGKVFDTSKPEQRQSNCYDCHFEKEDYDHDSSECPTCQQHGWS